MLNFVLVDRLKFFTERARNEIFLSRTRGEEITFGNLQNYQGLLANQGADSVCREAIKVLLILPRGRDKISPPTTFDFRSSSNFSPRSFEAPSPRFNASSSSSSLGAIYFNEGREGEKKLRRRKIKYNLLQ